MIKKVKFWNKLNLFCSSMLVAGMLIFMIPSNANAQGVLVDPPCETTTCISNEMIEIAKNENVKYDDMNMRWDLLLPEPYVPCKSPRPTGIMVYRQIPRDLELFTDIFCINPGCEPTIDGSTCESAY